MKLIHCVKYVSELFQKIVSEDFLNSFCNYFSGCKKLFILLLYIFLRIKPNDEELTTINIANVAPAVV